MSKVPQEREESPSEWLAVARQRFEQGRAAFERGNVVNVTPDELMDGIESELGIGPLRPVPGIA